ncbi:hypothetical protein [Azorhizobium doebereinerae]|uniref:hypothetical protein n=1 Tax=Azorhizobium doebereinerae TaxID=281091 RepID=UPI0003F7E654|nr:hypothetical protein [Azorhizobium doebereinerae]
MDSVFRLLLRLLLIPIGLLAAILSGVAIILFGQWRIGALADQNFTPETWIAVMEALFTGTFLVTFLVCVMWLVGLVGVLFAETFAVRSWIFHVANGAVSAFVGAWLFPTVSGEASPPADPFYILAAGLAGGLVYWLVAGWSAGFWRPLRPAQALPRTPAPPAA